MQLLQLLEDATGESFTMQNRLSRHASAYGISTGAPTRKLPFVTPTMLALKHPWSGARLIPMAANIQWLLYDCGDAPEVEINGSASPAATPEMHGLWVKMLHNEREVQFPPCMVHTQHTGNFSSHGGASNVFASRYGLHFPCPWNVVKDYFRKVAYPARGIETCDADDWVRLCGGVGECVADD